MVFNHRVGWMWLDTLIFWELSCFSIIFILFVKGAGMAQCCLRTLLPPMIPGFDSLTWPHVWIEVKELKSSPVKEHLQLINLWCVANWFKGVLLKGLGHAILGNYEL